ncbi:hypothetical protein IJH06_02515 [Candidatus Saccharibacteria bacterium]|nr:hypothetical protein [Candidatus Saccharibacteria bacterium]
MENLNLLAAINPVPCDGCPENLFVVFKDISNVVLGFIGIIAVVMLVIGGIRYMVSGGDSKKITDAKNTVLYAIIGLVICLLSAIIVNTVITVLPNTEITVPDGTTGAITSTCA